MNDEVTRVTTKRFIAGAVCPACGGTDCIKMWDVDGVPHRECIDCGYADTLNAQGQSVPTELGTRVNKVQPKPAKVSSAEAAQCVYPPRKNHTHARQSDELRSE